MLNKSLPKFRNKQERIEYWRIIYKTFITSNLTNVKFCAHHNISKATLYKWIRYFKKLQENEKQSSKTNLAPTNQLRKKSHAKDNATFIPVTITNKKAHTLLEPANIRATTTQPETLSSIELLLPNGVRIIFKQEANIELLMQLVTARY